MDTVIKFENIMRVGDLSVVDISKEAYTYLKEHGEKTYKDTIMHEDLYDVSNTLENEDDLDMPPAVKEELQNLLKALQKEECGYVRIVY